MFNKHFSTGLILAISVAMVGITPTTSVASASDTQSVNLTGGGNDYYFNAAFQDVTPHTLHAGAISWLYEEGITTGWKTADGTRQFRPLQSISREAMAAFIYRYAGSPAAEETGCFPDIAGSNFQKEICWMKKMGLTKGYPDGGYHPFASVNRDATAAFLHRLSKDTGTYIAADTAQIFTDVPRDLEHAQHIAWMKQEGISTGWPDGSFRPRHAVTRDAMAAFLYRYDKLQKLKTAVADLHAQCKYEEYNAPTSAVRTVDGAEVNVNNKLECTGLTADRLTGVALAKAYPQVEYLVMKDTVINDGETGAEFDPQLPAMQVLHIYDSKQTQIADYTGMPKLQDLEVQTSKITSVPDFSNIPEMFMIGIVDSELTELPDFSHMPKMTNLGFNVNHLGSVPDFSHMPKLLRVDLANNKELTAVPDFSNMKELRSLSLSSTGIASLPDFTGLPSLTRLLVLLTDLPERPVFTHMRDDLKIIYTFDDLSSGPGGFPF